MSEITIVGAGLSGCEAAWQAAESGILVNLYEMRPVVNTPAHITDQFAELVCSNSLGSNLPNRASGLLKNELRQFPSLLLQVANEYALPAGGALAVDRERFAETVTERISQHPSIRVIRKEIKNIPTSPCIIASGPLTSPDLAGAISRLTGNGNLFFYDALAPIFTEESIDMNIAFRASRYQRGEEESGDYINCPLSKDDYERFIEELSRAERIQLKEFEQNIDEVAPSGPSNFFEGCLPVEVIAQRGHDSLAFGPMRPVGLTDPRTGRRPYAVVQLRQDNLQGSMYNMVGFQTNLKYGEQKRVFSMIPGLGNADFIRYGQMHRNTYIASPALLRQSMQMREYPNIFFAGQITGIEGYMGNIASGAIAGINISRYLSGKPLLEFPPDTMMGALCHYITSCEEKNFQPMKANLGLLPPLEEKIRSKKERGTKYAERALSSLSKFMSKNSLNRAAI